MRNVKTNKQRGGQPLGHNHSVSFSVSQIHTYIAAGHLPVPVLLCLPMWHAACVQEGLSVFLGTQFRMRPLESQVCLIFSLSSHASQCVTQV